MQNRLIAERLTKLRQAMKKNGIDFYMVPTADWHNSEYVNEYFMVRKFFSGFSGSNGTLLVWGDGAGLWTDGRYFIQAEKELTGTGIQLFRMLDEGVPTIEEFLLDSLKSGQTLGFDGRVITAQKGIQLEKRLKEKEIRFQYNVDLSEEIWSDRPEFPAGPVTVLTKEVAGLSVEEKLSKVRSEFVASGAQSMFLSKLDDIMWLFNIRGCDVEGSPVAMSHAYITEKEVVLFLQEKALTASVKDYFSKNRITLKEYDGVMDYLVSLPSGIRILTDRSSCSYAIYKKLAEGRILIDKKNPTERLKALKNPVELSHMREVYLKDSVAVTKFIYWLKSSIGKQTITEITAAEYLDGLRRQIPGFLDLSFSTIAGYRENAAMMHYRATLEEHAVLAPEGMLLVDSGGQYLGGTTDVTRTIVLGPVSQQIKEHYTLVTAGMLQLLRANWIYGCTGRNLDILARQPLWDVGIDYKCGTGHGIGYILNVHEGPQNIRWRYAEGMEEAVLESGMVVSDEPGVYVEGSYGIRIENILVACNGVKNEYGQFMHFENLTYVPIDLDGIDVSLLDKKQRGYLNDYHRAVYEKVVPFLSEAEAAWLKEATREI